MQAKTGRDNDFLSALQRLRGEESDISEEAEEIKVLNMETNNHLLCSRPNK